MMSSQDFSSVSNLQVFYYPEHSAAIFLHLINVTTFTLVYGDELDKSVKFFCDSHGT